MDYGNIDPTATPGAPIRRQATEREILLAIRDRLRAMIPHYNDQNCFLSEAPIPDQLPGGRECCTISSGGGAFVGPHFGGGTVETLTDDLVIDVTPLIKHRRDRNPRDTEKLLSAETGLIQRKADILAALLADDFDPYVIDYEGTRDERRRYLLRDQLTPARAAAAGDTTVGTVEMTGLTITLFTPFDWSLVKPAECNGGDA